MESNEISDVPEMMTNKNAEYKIDQNWLSAPGDIDDFIFYYDKK